MNFVYAIIAHNGPKQLLALIDRICLEAKEGDLIILHLDKRSSLWRECRSDFANHPSGKVRLVERPATVLWAHKSLVQAQILLLEAALKYDFDYFHLISGADWPVQSRAAIVSDIKAFGETRPIFASIFGEKDQHRMQHWWFDTRKFHFKNHPRLAANVGRAQTRLSWITSRLWLGSGLSRSKYHESPWFKGGGWYSLPSDVVATVCYDGAKLLKSGRLSFTQCSDEHVVPTILSRRFADRIQQDHRYINWLSGGDHPKVLTEDDKDAIANSGAWFARKFDSNVDPFFLDPRSFDPSSST